MRPLILPLLALLLGAPAPALAADTTRHVDCSDGASEVHVVTSTRTEGDGRTASTLVSAETSATGGDEGSCRIEVRTGSDPIPALAAPALVALPPVFPSVAAAPVAARPSRPSSQRAPTRCRTRRSTTLRRTRSPDRHGRRCARRRT